MGSPATRCLNCDAVVDSPFCRYCGQRASTHRITVRHLIEEIPHAIFHVDRGLVPTVKALFQRPGQLVAEFLAGRRARYFNPLTLLVICSSLCALLWTFFPFKAALFWSTVPRGVESAFLNALLERWLKLVGFSQLLWLPVLAAWLYWSLRNARRRVLARHYAKAAAQDALATRAHWPGWLRHTLSACYSLGAPFMFGKRARAELKDRSLDLNFGELLVVASFMTSASLLLTAAASVIVFWVQHAAAYAGLICAAAVLSAYPTYQLLRTVPDSFRPTRSEAFVTAVYFVIGTPFGFLLAIQLFTIAAR